MKNWKLEFIRGGAALLVFICHLVINNPFLKSKIYLNVISNWGTEAVMLFFMLSGVVINLAQKRKYNTPFIFLKNRLLRIYPLYIVGILLATFVIIFLNTEILNPYKMVGNLFFIGTLQGYIIDVPSSNPVIWSLTFEMFFYLIYCIGIGKSKIKFMLIWFGISLFCIPIYYLGIIGFPGFLITILSFSSIWLIGYFIAEYSNFIEINSIKVAIIFFALLPAISRLHLSNLYYDVFKYLIFSICASPFFLYCLKSNGLNKNKKILIISLNYAKIAMVFVFASLLLFSNSLFISKIIYIFIPLLFFIIPFKNISFYLLNFLKKISIYFGSISYVLYIVHFPILILINFYSHGNVFLYILISILLIFPTCNFLEFKYQRLVFLLVKNNFFNKLKILKVSK